MSNDIIFHDFYATSQYADCHNISMDKFGEFHNLIAPWSIAHKRGKLTAFSAAREAMTKSRSHI